MLALWLENNCPVPIKDNFGGIQNKFISEDVIYMIEGTIVRHAD